MMMKLRNAIAALAGMGPKPACRDDRRYWLVYDGRCSLCSELAAWIHRLDVSDRVLPIDLYSHADRIVCRAPHLDREALSRAVHLISPRCEVWAGFYAVRRLARLMPVLWPALPMLHVPGSSWMGPKAYEWVAQNRHRALGCRPGIVCPTHAQSVTNP